MKKYLVSAIIKETSPRFNRINYIYGNELVEFKIKAESEQQIIKTLAFAYVTELKKLYSFDRYDLRTINRITISDIEYIISEL